MFGHREMVMEDYTSILRRRKWLLIVPAILGPVLAYGVSRFLPEKYTSQTMVLVQQQRVPDKFVASVVTDTLSQRLSTMRDEILSRTQLQPLIEKFQLYKGGSQPMEDLVATMRNNVVVKPITTTASPTSPVTGFSISFTADDPHVAQQVTQQLLSKFIEQNSKIREESAKNTTGFLTKQLEDAKQKLDDQDTRMAQFKRRYMGQLPGNENANLSLLMSSNTQLEAVSALLNRAVQDKQFAETLLSNQLDAWKASQSGANPITMDAQLTALEGQLRTAEARYTADHPDVVRLKTEIAELKTRAAEAAKQKDKEPSRPTTPSLSEPPQIVSLRAQIHQLNQTIQEKTRDQERMREQIRVFQARVQLSPAVEQEYKEITRDYQTAAEFYQDLLNKKTQSEISEKLEKSQQGEMFKVMDAPNLPERPTFPDRRLFAAGGLGGGLVLGLVIAFLLEFRDKSLRTELDIERCLQLPSLVSLPSVDLAGQTARPLLAAKTKG